MFGIKFDMAEIETLPDSNVVNMYLCRVSALLPDMNILKSYKV